MAAIHTLDRHKDAAITRLFSAGVVRDLAQNGKCSSLLSLVQQAGMWDVPNIHTVGDVYDHAFTHLRKAGLRNEYVYQSAIVRNVLLGKHSLKTASMLREFRTGDSRADVVILNGTSTVYEIKSERDSLQRLRKQMDDYSKVFARLYVIAAENHIDSILETVPDYVGVMSLKRWNRISTFREALDRHEQIQPASVLGSLRRAEAIKILKLLGIAEPKVPNTQMYGHLEEIFMHLDSEAVHAAMVQVLKKSRTQQSLERTVADLPASLHAATLMYRLKEKCGARLACALKTPLSQTTYWD